MSSSSAKSSRSLRHAGSITPTVKKKMSGGSAGGNTTDADDKLESRFRYQHLSDDKRVLIDAILKGRFKMDEMPIQRKKMVRIFISSTFSDMNMERNELMKRVYPMLREYCRNKYGVEFQVVDMRWGIQSQAKDDHSTMELCLNEIRSCQKFSIGPNFVGFIGQRQGAMHLMSAVESSEFESIRKELVASGSGVSLLNKWYTRDKNALPSVHVLRPISSVIDEKEDWTVTSTELRKLLLTGAKKAAEKGTIPAEKVRAYNSSVTEKEIAEGLLDIHSQRVRDNNCVLFIREIEDILHNLSNPVASRFVDMANSTVNQIAFTAIDKLRNKRLVSKLSDANVLRGKVTWHELQHPSREQSDVYIERVINFFSTVVKRLIDRNMSHELSLVNDELYGEVLQHWALVRSRCSSFVGRNEELKPIKSYMTSDTDRVLVLHADSGYGKTSLMAKAASEVKFWMWVKHGQDFKPIVIQRFCGTTPGSSKIPQLLRSICHQIAYATGKYRHKIPQEYRDVKRYFLQIVQQGISEGALVIFLDALDQLSSDESAHKLDWLPSKLAKNVKIVVSCLPDKYNILKRLKRKIDNEENFVPVQQMKTELCCEIVRDWLGKRNRTLSNDQWELVKSAFQHCSSAIFTKLTFEDVSRWNSYSVVDEQTLGKSVEQCINILLSRMEGKHGETLVERCFGYITASNAGLSAGELEDILSLDEQVLNSIFEYWEPPVRRIPPILMYRIFYDIEQFLVEREAHGLTVIYWYHRQFEQAATQRYLNDARTVRVIHNNMADYYIGTWSGDTKKPFKYEGLLQKRLRLSDPNSSAVRHVPEQPLTFHKYDDTNNQTTVPNLRKMAMLPYHLYFSDRLKDLYNLIYFNYEWLHCKLPATSMQQVLADFNLSNDYEVGLVADALRMSEKVLASCPDSLGIEITGRLLPHYTTSINVKKLIDQCDKAAKFHSHLLANKQLYTAPGGPLQYVCEHQLSGSTSLSVKLIRSIDTTFLTAKSVYSNTVKVWDISIGEPKQDLALGLGELYPTEDGKYICLFKNSKFVQIYNTESGELFGEIEYGYGKVTSVAMGDQFMAFCNDGSASPIVLDLLNKKLLQKFNYQSNIITISADQTFMLCSYGKCLALYDLPGLERRCVVTVENEPHKVLFTSSPHFILMTKDKEMRSYQVNLAKRKAVPKLIVRDVEMRGFTLSHTQTLILVHAARSLYVFEAATNELKYRIHNMPPGDFVEKQSVFKEAYFTTEDKNVIASRHRYIGVWDAENGDPLRLIQASLSPIERLFTLITDNKAITVCADQSIQVWNLNNLQGDIHHMNHIAIGSIVKATPTTSDNKYMCFARRSSEAHVVDAYTGKTTNVLRHTSESNVHIIDVVISGDGMYATTMADKASKVSFSLAQEVILWDLANQAQVRTFESVHHVLFSSDNETLVITKCRFKNKRDWTDNSYTAIVVNLVNKQTQQVDLPDAEVIGEPVISGNGKSLIYLIQKCIDQLPINDKSIVDRNFQIHLAMIDLKAPSSVNLKTLANIWPGAEPDMNLLSIRPSSEENFTVIYAKQMPLATPKDQAFLYRKSTMDKGAFIFSALKSDILYTYRNFLKPDSMIDETLITKSLSMALDDKGRTFNNVNATQRSDFGNDVTISMTRFLLNGKYLVTLSANQQEVRFLRTSTGDCVTQCPVHGEASCIAVGNDERTVYVGTSDGRVMMMTFIMEDPDVDVTTRGIRHRSFTERDTPMMKVLIDMAIRSTAHEQTKPGASSTRPSGRRLMFRRMSQAVLMSKSVPRVKSQACALQ